MPTARGVLCAIVGVVASLVTTAASAELTGYNADFIEPARLVDIDPTTGAGSSPPPYVGCFFTPGGVNETGFTSGLAYIGDTLYGIEFSGDDLLLNTFSVGTFGCAVYTRVGAVSVGFPELESLTYCSDDGFLYSVDWDGPAHEGQLIRIDPATGVGTSVGDHLPRNVKVVGLTYDGATGFLYALTAGFGAPAPDSRPAELFTIDPDTGARMLIGATGTAPSSSGSPVLEGLALVGDELFAAGTELRKLNRTTGAAMPPISGYSGTVWGLAVRDSCDALGGDPDADGICTNGDGLPEYNPCTTGVTSACDDNCPNVANGNPQEDTDGNGIGDGCQCGDVNGDGVTNVTDALLIARGQVASEDPHFGKCDVTGDTFCNVTDALTIARGQVGSSVADQLCPTYLGTTGP